MTKEIPLTQGQVALVDDWWYEELNQYKWHAAWSPGKRAFYAMRNAPMLLGKQKRIWMHAVIAGTPKGMDTDHINGKTLDNQGANLRVCTHAQNVHNSNKRTDNTSGFKGVSKHKHGWQARVGIGGESKYLGIYSTPDAAGRAYDEAAKQLHGEFANLNFP